MTGAETQVAALVEGVSPIAAVRERIAVLETRAPVPGPPGPPGPPGRDGSDDAQDLRSAQAALKDDLAAVRERVVVIEVRQPIPGPTGPAGRDGSDGVGFEDLAVVQRDDRSFTITATHGDRVKEIGTAAVRAATSTAASGPTGRTYEPGDGVTWAGSEWHCHSTTTTKPGDGSKAWTLKVKRGRDGKDGKDGPPGPPGPAGRDWQQVYDDTRRR